MGMTSLCSTVPNEIILGLENMGQNFLNYCTVSACAENVFRNWYQDEAEMLDLMRNLDTGMNAPWMTVKTNDWKMPFRKDFQGMAKLAFRTKIVSE